MSKTMFGTTDTSMATLLSWFPSGKYGVISAVDVVVDMKAAAPSTKAAAKDEPFYKTTWGIVGISEACILVVLVIFALVFYMKRHDSGHEQRDLRREPTAESTAHRRRQERRGEGAAQRGCASVQRHRSPQGCRKQEGSRNVNT